MSVTISIPRSLKRLAFATARAQHLSLSAFLAERLREYYREWPPR